MVIVIGTSDFNTVYRPGKSNTDADILVRYPGNIDIEPEEILSDSMKVICASVVTLHLETMSTSVDIRNATEFPGEPKAQIEQRENKKQQLDDSCLGFGARAVRNKTKPYRDTLRK